MFYLINVSRYGDVLQAVVTYTEDLAYKQAKEADRLLEEGQYLGIQVSLLNMVRNCSLETCS